MIVFCLLCWEGRWLYIAVTYTQGHFSFLFSLLEELIVFRMFYRVVSFPSLNVCESRFSWLHRVLGSWLLVYGGRPSLCRPLHTTAPAPSSNSTAALVLLLPPRVSAGIWKDPRVTTGGDTEVPARTPPPRTPMDPLRPIPPVTSGQECRAVVQSVPCGFTWERLKCLGDTSWH